LCNRPVRHRYLTVRSGLICIATLGRTDVKVSYPLVRGVSSHIYHIIHIIIATNRANSSTSRGRYRAEVLRGNFLRCTENLLLLMVSGKLKMGVIYCRGIQ
jgi:hypothetical protein